MAGNSDVLQSGIVGRLKGLRKTEWNGELGLVGDFNASKNRYSFHLLHLNNAGVLIKPENIVVDDRLFIELLEGESGKIDECHKLPVSLARELCLYPGKYAKLEEFCLEEGLYHFSFNAFGHEFFLDIRQCINGDKFGRLVQSWVKTDGFGFDAKTWCGQLSWWNEKKLSVFLRDMNKLRETLITLTQDEFLECVPKGENSRNWALDILSRLETEGLTIMPGTLDQEAEYVASMEAQGFPARAVVFRGISIGNPTQLLDFPIDQWRTVVTISKQWFTEFNSACFVKAIEWYQITGDWTWRKFMNESDV